MQPLIAIKPNEPISRHEPSHRHDRKVTAPDLAFVN